MARRQKSVFVILCLTILFFLSQVYAQDNPHGVSVHFNYTSGSRIFLTPFSSNPIFRSDSYEIGSAFSISGDYRFSFTENVKAGVSFEYLPNEITTNDANNTRYIDGYKLYLLELSGYFTLPIGGKTFQLYVGGGVGTYFGTRPYSIAGVGAHPITHQPAVGIHVVSGMEYSLLKSFSLRAEFHFRDPQITTENQFPVSSILSNGVEYLVGEKPFKSKVNINGNVYAFGIVFHF